MLQLQAGTCDIDSSKRSSIYRSPILIAERYTNSIALSEKQLVESSTLPILIAIDDDALFNSKFVPLNYLIPGCLQCIFRKGRELQ